MQMLPLAVQDLLLYILLIWPYIGIVMGVPYVFALGKFVVVGLLALVGIGGEKKQD